MRPLPIFKARFADLGSTVFSTSPAALGKFIARRNREMGQGGIVGGDFDRMEPLASAAPTRAGFLWTRFALPTR
jgi:hypothetical protein